MKIIVNAQQRVQRGGETGALRNVAKHEPCPKYREQPRCYPITDHAR
jgi:hypothetical protein